MSSNPPRKFALVGNPDIVRLDGYTHITGQTKFTSDILPPDVGVSSTTGFLYMGYVMCPYPHAKITKIDTSKAEAAGYVTLTGQDAAYLPPYTYYSTAGNRFRGPLPISEAKFAGQPVVAVGAPSPDLVNDAIALVDVEYQPLPYVLDTEAALKAGAPRLWPGGNAPGGAALEGISTPSTAVVKIGDAAGAIAQADAVVNVQLDTGFTQHFDIEPRGLIVQWNAGVINIWGNTQYAHGLLGTVANYFGVPRGNVIVRSSLGNFKGQGEGCGLGNKTSGEEYIIATAMSKKAGMPVKFMHTRTSHAVATTNRFPERAYITVAGKAGMITAFKAVVYANVGANGGASSDLGMFYACYTVPNLDLTSYSVNTNAFGLAGPQRDVGESQNHFFVEVAVDMLAEKMNIDPNTFRMNNMRTAAYTDSTGKVWPNTAVDINTGYPFSGYGQPGAHLQAVKAFNWTGRWKGWGVPSAVLTNSGETNGTGKKLRGVGMALTAGAKGSLGGGATGQIQVDPKGNITVFTGGTDHGGGWMTSGPIIAGELLGQTDFSHITLITSDTSLTTDTGGTYGSRMTRNGGMGLVAAAQDLKNQWFPVVAANLAPGTKATNLAFGNNTIYDTTNPSNSMSFAAAAALLKAPVKGNGNFPSPPKTAYRVGGTKMCEVEVDVETGDVRILDYVGCLGVGRVIFRSGADQQSEGGLVGTGQGETLYEEIVLDSSTGLNLSGRYLSPNYLDFKIPTIMQTPNTMQALYEEYVDPLGPFGAVGMGENVQMCTTPMILNALTNALGGYRFTHYPVRREDIVAALQWMKDNGKL
ncbi:MAG: xanthine dehydrogenase family protein molybdopterin-binding subunit [Nitrososphaerota archaeon]|nr:xanthine dehydrogenase family protein molybdopterin-binding subunit [Nitrososphaerota archaeon]